MAIALKQIVLTLVRVDRLAVHVSVGQEELLGVGRAVVGVGARYDGLWWPMVGVVGQHTIWVDEDLLVIGVVHWRDHLAWWL